MKLFQHAELLRGASKPSYRFSQALCVKPGKWNCSDAVNSYASRKFTPNGHTESLLSSLSREGISIKAPIPQQENV